MPAWPRAERLETQRLTLEPLRRAHAAEMAVVLADPALYEHTGGAPPSLRELQVAYSRRERGRSPDGSQGWLNWIVRKRSGGTAVGYVQATLSGGDDACTADLAWVIATQDQGVGLASEAAAAACAWLEATGARTLAASIAPGNVASERVARRLGLDPTDELVGGEVRWAREGTPA